MNATDPPDSGGSVPGSGIPVAHGPATAAETPIISPLTDGLLYPQRRPLTPLQAHVARVLRHAPAPAVAFVLRWWAVISGRRVPGLAAEAAFWVVFSLPWLLLAIITGLGFLAKWWGPETVATIEQVVMDAVNDVLTPQAASSFAVPVLQSLFHQNRAELSVIGIALALWSGSRAITTYVEAISIINGEFGVRGYLRRRVLAMVLYAMFIVLMILVFPITIVGPKNLGDWLDLPSELVTTVCVSLGFGLAICLLCGLYHYSAVDKLPWRSTLPGALLALAGSTAAGFGLTWYVRQMFEDASVYGVLATPIAVMIFAFVLSFIALAGAAFNAVLWKRPIFAEDLAA